MAEETEVFVYMGEGGPAVPQDVVRVRVHTSVIVLPEDAFKFCWKLKEVELCEGLLEIGCSAFKECRRLEEIRLPEGLLEIGAFAFSGCDLVTISIPDTVERIDQYALFPNDFTKLRIPPRVTQLSQGVFEKSRSMFSLEISKSIIEIGRWAFCHCYSLRNIAIPSTTFINDVEGTVFIYCMALQELFSSGEEIINALKHRFDNLPIHKMIYYQSYNNMTADQLNIATDIRISRSRSKLNPSGKQQDCLGMTPLHILACSTVQNIELYKVLINKYPENLITKDRWGALPLLYAVWGGAPEEIVHFLVESYKSIYPDFELNWTDMLVALGEASVGLDVIQNILDIRKDFFPGQRIVWGIVLDKLGYEGRRAMEPETFLFLLKCSISTRIEAIGLKSWRTEITSWLDVKKSYNLYLDEKRWTFLEEFETKLRQYQTEYRTMREATTVLELALWKQNLDKQKRQRAINTFFEKREHKKMKIEALDLRKQCRINCKADIVIEHVLPYLVSKPVVQFSIDDSDSESEDDDW